MNCKECGKDETEVTFNLNAGAKTCNRCYHKHRLSRQIVEKICISCGKKPLFTKRYCEACAKKRRESRRTKIEKGICVYNGCKDFPKPKSTFCPRHANLVNASAKYRHHEKIKNGICADHGCHEFVDTGLTLCRKHMDNYSVRGRRSRFRYSVENEQKWQDAVDGKISCEFCGLPFNNETPNQDHDHACCPGKNSCGKCLRGIVHPICNTAGIVWLEWYERQMGIDPPLMLKAYRDKFPRRI